MLPCQRVGQGRISIPTTPEAIKSRSIPREQQLLKRDDVLQMPFTQALGCLTGQTNTHEVQRAAATALDTSATASGRTHFPRQNGGGASSRGVTSDSCASRHCLINRCLVPGGLGAGGAYPHVKTLNYVPYTNAANSHIQPCSMAAASMSTGWSPFVMHNHGPALPAGAKPLIVTPGFLLPVGPAVVERPWTGQAYPDTMPNPRRDPNSAQSGWCACSFCYPCVVQSTGEGNRQSWLAVTLGEIAENGSSTLCRKGFLERQSQKEKWAASIRSRLSEFRIEAWIGYLNGLSGASLHALYRCQKLVAGALTPVLNALFHKDVTTKELPRLTVEQITHIVQSMPSNIWIEKPKITVQRFIWCMRRAKQQQELGAKRTRQKAVAVNAAQEDASPKKKHRHDLELNTDKSLGLPDPLGSLGVVGPPPSEQSSERGDDDRKRSSFRKRMLPSLDNMSGYDLSGYAHVRTVRSILDQLIADVGKYTKTQDAAVDAFLTMAESFRVKAFKSQHQRSGPGSPPHVNVIYKSTGQKEIPNPQEINDPHQVILKLCNLDVSKVQMSQYELNSSGREGLRDRITVQPGVDAGGVRNMVFSQLAVACCQACETSHALSVDASGFSLVVDYLIFVLMHHVCLYFLSWLQPTHHSINSSQLEPGSCALN